jgi:EPS-associated MarR family transcriptional regulator
MPNTPTPQPTNLYEIHLHVLRAIEQHPGLTQRQLASVLGVSLGKAHYCMKALVEKGLVKMGNFSHNQKKLDYAYLLTPKGIKSKTALTMYFLQRKELEYEQLKAELERTAPNLNVNQGRDADSKTAISNLM